ncbi:MAG: ribulose-phosphate 3-epimerase [Oscillospiraceae bacterium]|nr:ribulose-phosphate 3-epimerase [Oscillospiraceae bacterium]
MSAVISASILASDLLNIEKTVSELENSGIDMIHYDVMDGVFVDNITYGEVILKKMRSITDMFLDVHLMTIKPLALVGGFANAGASSITFHLESSSDAFETIRAIKSYGLKAGISIKPDTEADKVIPYLPYVDSVLVMTVEPGKGGQSFMFETLEKVMIISEYIKASDCKCIIQVDGGINTETARLAYDAGARNLVAGTFIFKANDMKAAADSIRF